MKSSPSPFPVRLHIDGLAVTEQAIPKSGRFVLDIPIRQTLTDGPPRPVRLALKPLAACFVAAQLGTGPDPRSLTFQLERLAFELAPSVRSANVRTTNEDIQLLNGYIMIPHQGI